MAPKHGPAGDQPVPLSELRNLRKRLLACVSLTEARTAAEAWSVGVDQRVLVIARDELQGCVVWLLAAGGAIVAEYRPTPATYAALRDTNASHDDAGREIFAQIFQTFRAQLPAGVADFDLVMMEPGVEYVVPRDSLFVTGSKRTPTYYDMLAVAIDASGLPAPGTLHYNSTRLSAGALRLSHSGDINQGEWLLHTVRVSEDTPRGAHISFAIGESGYNNNPLHRYPPAGCLVLDVTSRKAFATVFYNALEDVGADAICFFPLLVGGHHDADLLRVAFVDHPGRAVGRSAVPSLSRDDAITAGRLLREREYHAAPPPPLSPAPLATPLLTRSLSQQEHETAAAAEELEVRAVMLQSMLAQAPPPAAILRELADLQDKLLEHRQTLEDLRRRRDVAACPVAADDEDEARSQALLVVLGPPPTEFPPWVEAFKANPRVQVVYNHDGLYASADDAAAAAAGNAPVLPMFTFESANSSAFLEREDMLTLCCQPPTAKLGFSLSSNSLVVVLASADSVSDTARRWLLQGEARANNIVVVLRGSNAAEPQSKEFFEGSSAMANSKRGEFVQKLGRNVAAMIGPFALVVGEFLDEDGGYRYLASAPSTCLPGVLDHAPCMGEDVTVVIQERLVTAIGKPRALPSRVLVGDALKLPFGVRLLQMDELLDELSKLPLAPDKALESAFGTACSAVAMMLNEQDLKSFKTRALSALASRLKPFEKARGRATRELTKHMIDNGYRKDERLQALLQAQEQAKGALTQAKKALERYTARLAETRSSRDGRAKFSIKQEMRKAQVQDTIQLAERLSDPANRDEAEDWFGDMMDGGLALSAPVDLDAWRRMLRLLQDDDVSGCLEGICRGDENASLVLKDGHETYGADIAGAVMLGASHPDHEDEHRHPLQMGGPAALSPAFPSRGSHGDNSTLYYLLPPTADHPNPFHGGFNCAHKAYDEAIGVVRTLSRKLFGSTVIGREAGLIFSPGDKRVTWGLVALYMGMLVRMREAVGQRRDVQFDDTVPKAFRGMLLMLGTTLGSGENPISSLWSLFKSCMERPDIKSSMLRCEWDIMLEIGRCVPLAGWPVDPFAQSVRRWLAAVLNKRIVRPAIEPLEQVLIQEKKEKKQNAAGHLNFLRDEYFPRYRELVNMVLGDEALDEARLEELRAWFQKGDGNVNRRVWTGSIGFILDKKHTGKQIRAMCRAACDKRQHYDLYIKYLLRCACFAAIASNDPKRTQASYEHGAFLKRAIALMNERKTYLAYRMGLPTGADALDGATSAIPPVDREDSVQAVIDALRAYGAGTGPPPPAKMVRAMHATTAEQQWRPFQVRGATYDREAGLEEALAAPPASNPLEVGEASKPVEAEDEHDQDRQACAVVQTQAEQQLDAGCAIVESAGSWEKLGGLGHLICRQERSDGSLLHSLSPEFVPRLADLVAISPSTLVSLLGLAGVAPGDEERALWAAISAMLVSWRMDGAERERLGAESLTSAEPAVAGAEPSDMLEPPEA